MAKRREFTQTQRQDIVNRAKNSDGQICCERCGLVLAGKPYEIDHIIPEGLRPDEDKKRKLTIAEGQLLGKGCCHRGEHGKTKADQKQIAKSNRQFNKAHGLKRKTKPIQGPGFAKRPRKHEGRPSLPPVRMFKEME